MEGPVHSGPCLTRSSGNTDRAVHSVRWEGVDTEELEIHAGAIPRPWSPVPPRVSEGDGSLCCPGNGRQKWTPKWLWKCQRERGRWLHRPPSAPSTPRAPKHPKCPQAPQAFLRALRAPNTPRLRNAHSCLGATPQRPRLGSRKELRAHFSFSVFSSTVSAAVTTSCRCGASRGSHACEVRGLQGGLPAALRLSSLSGEPKVAVAVQILGPDVAFLFIQQPVTMRIMGFVTRGWRPLKEGTMQNLQNGS